MGRVTGLLTRFFDKQASRFVDLFRTKLKLASDDEEKIKEFLDRWTEIVGPLADELAAEFATSGIDTADELEAIGRITHTVIHAEALAYAQARAAELVGKKYVGRELVDNPDAKWAITTTTRDELKQLIEEAFAEGLTPAELQAAITETGVFSASRAKMIAQTEMTKAQTQGSLTTAKRTGATQKRVQLGNDHVPEDECDIAAEMEWIPIHDHFGVLGDGPPFHPRCHCVLIYGAQ